MTGDAKWPAAAAFLCATALALLALLVYDVGSIKHLDVRLFERLSIHNYGMVNTVGEAIARLADLLPLLGMLVVACYIALRRGRPECALAAAAVVAGANLTTQILKQVFPHQPVGEVIAGGHFNLFDFPSGHSTAAASIAIAFLFVVPRGLLSLTALLGATLALGVGCSVVVIAWHYPSDVLAGYLVAAGWGFATLAVVRALEPPPSPPTVSPRAPQPSR
jgi:membrane-associated phospholipid phosphatase